MQKYIVKNVIVRKGIRFFVHTNTDDKKEWYEMKKRLFFPLLFFVAAGTFLIFRMSQLAFGESLAQTAQNQLRYTVKVATTRGTVYDCNLLPITNAQSEKTAVAIGTPQVLAEIGKTMSAIESEALISRLQSGKPILFMPSASMQEVSGLRFFSVPTRYQSVPMAVHTVGYIDADMKGVSGIEKAFDEYLRSCGGDVSVTYSADALGRALYGEGLQLNGNASTVNSGIVLTLDSKIQRLAEDALSRVNAGAIVIMEVESGKIRAMASSPTFSPTNIQASLKDENSPFVNRALSAYNVGSVFKLVVACAAEEAGITIDPINCEGTMEYAGKTFQCINASKHGLTDFNRAIAVSCNLYFIRLAEKVGGERILEMAQKLGFGEQIKLADGIESSRGVLPSSADLSLAAALANFSFGQGDLLATPLQVASMIQTIANGGVRVDAQLVEGHYSESAGLSKLVSQVRGERVMSTETASSVMAAMIDAVNVGTVRWSKPKVGGAGAKTATAESGWSVNGETMIQAWCAGFYPEKEPKYVIVVLVENGRSGSGVSAPLFKMIADGLAEA